MVQPSYLPGHMVTWREYIEEGTFYLNNAFPSNFPVSKYVDQVSIPELDLAITILFLLEGEWENMEIGP